MKKVSYILAFVLAISFIEVKSQQDSQFTQYMYSLNVLNPAYAGSKETLSLSLLGRSQWVNVDGAPRTMTLSGHLPLKNNLGVGVSIVSDKIAVINENNVSADISYNIGLSSNSKLAFGLKGGVTMLDVDLLALETVTPGDVMFDENIDKTSPTLGAGMFYYTDKFYAGLSIPNFLETLRIEEDDKNNARAVESLHYYIMTGYVFTLSETVKLKPSLMLKTSNGAPLSVDVNANVLMFDKLELGVSYRLEDAVSALVNMRVAEGLRIGYAYDYTVSDFSNGYTGGSHEIMVLYNLPSIIDARLRSPRFF